MNKKSRACATAVVVVCAASASTIQIARSASNANDYPTRPIRLVAGIPPGGGVDIVARAISEKLSERLGKQVIVDNRTGAGGAVAMEIVAQANPDGYTLLAGSVGTITAATPLKKVRFDVRKAYEPVVEMDTQPYVLAVNSTLPVSSVKELIAYAKSKPGALNYASTGVGSTSQLGMEYFKYMAGVNITHVPYRGLGLAMIDVVSGQIQLMFGAAIVVIPNVRSGKLKALAVGGLQRSASYPEIPTVSESGLPGFEWTNSYALFAPAGTSPNIVATLNKQVAQIVNLPDVKKRLLVDGVEPAAPNTPAQFKKSVQDDIEKFEKLIKNSGISM